MPPGGELLARLLGDEPTLLLLDEVLIYVVKARALRRGDTNAGQQAFLFVQNLTEAINQRPRSAMVYSLQASVGEAVGEEALLSQLEKIAGRIDARREPVSGDEVLRVVQRRLFVDIGPEGVRREVARAYAEQLRGHLEATAETDADRVEARQSGDRLEQRVADAYPFHPELIDLMNHRWGALPTYQRTRGALQFLARVVHSLWASRSPRSHRPTTMPSPIDSSMPGPSSRAGSAACRRSPATLTREASANNTSVSATSARLSSRPVGLADEIGSTRPVSATTAPATRNTNGRDRPACSARAATSPYTANTTAKIPSPTINREPNHRPPNPAPERRHVRLRCVGGSAQVVRACLRGPCTVEVGDGQRPWGPGPLPRQPVANSRLDRSPPVLTPQAAAVCSASWASSQVCRTSAGVL